MEPRERPAREGRASSDGDADLSSESAAASSIELPGGSIEGRASSDGDADLSSESAAASSTERLGGSIETLRAREDALHRRIRKEQTPSRKAMLERHLDGVQSRISDLEDQLEELLDDEAPNDVERRKEARLEADSRSQMQQLERQRQIMQVQQNIRKKGRDDARRAEHTVTATS